MFTIKVLSSNVDRNLLRPSGARLTPATLSIGIFRAEDLPQMDPGRLHHKKTKALVDPYCTVSFSGSKGRTRVIWRRDDPKWNKQINLGVKVSNAVKLLWSLSIVLV